jgi:hypothetical protein
LDVAGNRTGAITTVWVVETDLALDPTDPGYDGLALRRLYKELLALARAPIKKIRIVPNKLT